MGGDGDGLTAMQVRVPDRAVSFLIGKQGCNVQAIEKQSKARLEFAKVGQRLRNCKEDL